MSCVTGHILPSLNNFGSNKTRLIGSGIWAKKIPKSFWNKTSSICLTRPVETLCSLNISVRKGEKWEDKKKIVKARIENRERKHQMLFSCESIQALSHGTPFHIFTISLFLSLCWISFTLPDYIIYIYILPLNRVILWYPIYVAITFP